MAAVIQRVRCACAVRGVLTTPPPEHKLRGNTFTSRQSVLFFTLHLHYLVSRIKIKVRVTVRVRVPG